MEKEDDKIILKRPMGETQVGQRAEVNIFKNSNTQSSIYLSTKDDTEIYDFLVDEKKILRLDYDFEHARKEEDGPAYLFKEDYTFLLGDNVLDLIGPDYNSEGNKFIASKNSHEKFVMYRKVYKKLAEKNKEGYKWFVDLYDKMVGLSEISLEWDEENKTLVFDIIWPSILEFKSTKYINQEMTDIPPHNRIIFGAPGTGKSHSLNKDRCEHFGERYERVTFHPNYSYSQFVGTYKPVPKLDNNNKPTGDITYDYVPGPFIRAYIEAYKEPDEPYLLLIEEINRANVTAVFGDVFQLLDRKNGESEFEIETSEDIRNHFYKEMKDEIKNGDFDCKRMKIPKNMYIWATMNSADQGVFPMDTAFKRRWDFEYIGIDHGVDDNYKEYQAKFPGLEEPINWNKLRKGINKKLSRGNVNEDKLLGPYFISKDILDKMDKENYDINNEFIKSFKSKILMYLFEDAGKHCEDLFEGFDGRPTFSEILDKFDKKGLKIFGDDFPEKLSE